MSQRIWKALMFGSLVPPTIAAIAAITGRFAIASTVMAIAFLMVYVASGGASGWST